MLVPSSFVALSTQGPPGITPGSAFVNPRIVMGAAAIVIASILLLLYLYRRRLFILWWISGWILLAASMFLVARPYLNQKLGWMAYGASQFLGISARWRLSLPQTPIATGRYSGGSMGWSCSRSLSGSRWRRFLSGPTRCSRRGTCSLPARWRRPVARTCSCCGRSGCWEQDWSV